MRLVDLVQGVISFDSLQALNCDAIMMDLP